MHFPLLVSRFGWHLLVVCFWFAFRLERRTGRVRRLLGADGPERASGPTIRGFRPPPAPW